MHSILPVTEVTEKTMGDKANTMLDSSELFHRSEELPRDVAELIEAVAHLSAEHRQQIAPILDRVIESTKRRRRIVQLVQEALSQLRLDMKYLMFDLEATRRERDAFRHQSE